MLEQKRKSSSSCKTNKKRKKTINERNYMKRKIKSIYELCNKYTKEEILEVLNNLSEEELSIIKERYGNNLNDLQLEKNGIVKNQKNTIIPKKIN